MKARITIFPELLKNLSTVISKEKNQMWSIHLDYLAIIDFESLLSGVTLWIVATEWYSGSPWAPELTAVLWII